MDIVTKYDEAFLSKKKMTKHEFHNLNRKFKSLTNYFNLHGDEIIYLLIDCHHIFFFDT